MIRIESGYIELQKESGFSLHFRRTCQSSALAQNSDHSEDDDLHLTGVGCICHHPNHHHYHHADHADHDD